MPIMIEPFALDRYEAVLALWHQCPGVGLSDADARPNIAAFLARNPGLSFVATDGDRVVGAVLCGHDGRRGYLHHMAVHPDFRRQGIGHRLAARCRAALGAAGIRKCHLFIFSDNGDGQAFWQSAGWSLRQDIRVMSAPVVAPTATDEEPQQ